MKQNISLQIFIQPEVTCDFLWGKKKKASILRRASLLQSTLLFLPASGSCVIIWNWMKWIHGCFCIYMTFSIPSVHRHTIMSGSLQAKTLFGTISSLVLERYPTARRKSIISLYNCSASSYSAALYEEPRCIWWYVQRNEQRHINTRNTHFMAYLISESAQPPAYSCLTMKTIHSAS